MDVQTLQHEIRDYLLNQALNDLSIIRWTLVEERIHDGVEYLDALLAYRDAKLASLRADKEYLAFIVNATNWEEEERLYNMVRRCNFELNYTDQILMDMILESDSYKKMVQESVELPDYG
jgi:hypothetical protein